MKIRGKITLLVTAVVLLVVGAIGAQLTLVERGRVRAEARARVDTLLEGVQRIARESLGSQDELMLLSYLKFLMKDYPEMRLAVISRRDHSSLLGQASPDLDYRDLTVVEAAAASFKPADRAQARPRPQAASGRLPEGALSLQLGFSKSELERRIRAAQRAVAYKVASMAAVGLVLGVLGSWVVGRWLSRPVRELARAAKRLGEGDLATLVKPRSADEIGDLGREFNAMAARLADHIRFKEELMSALSHELNAPLGGLKGYLDYLTETKASEDPAERRQAYETMARAVEQMEVSLRGALELFRTDGRPAVSARHVCLNDLAAEVVELFKPLARAAGVALEGPASEPRVALRCDPEHIRRVVINLVSNAVKYTPEGGRVALRIAQEAEGARLSVADTGPGIAPADRERIFTKFYRAPGPDGRAQRIPGSGIGLATAKQSVDLHGGRIWVESEPGRGSVFHVALPKTAGEVL